jgi:hypothetical protein
VDGESAEPAPLLGVAALSTNLQEQVLPHTMAWRLLGFAALSTNLHERLA